MRLIRYEQLDTQTKLKIFNLHVEHEVSYKNLATRFNISDATASRVVREQRAAQSEAGT